jgi:hypothetical protein
VNDIVWDNTHQVLYASVPANAPNYANEILTINPSTGAIVSSQLAGNDPDVLAISDDDQYLYVGNAGDSTIERFILPSMTPDISWSLGSCLIGPCIAVDIQVAPGFPHTTAVSLGNDGGVVIYDDSTSRPMSVSWVFGTFVSLQWGADDAALYGSDDYSKFYLMSVDTNGATLMSTVWPNCNYNACGAIHFDSGTGDIYFDVGIILDAAGNSVGSFQNYYPFGVIATDSSINQAFHVVPGNESTCNSGFGAGIGIRSYDMTTLQAIACINILPTQAFTANKMIRWGTNGLVLTLNNGDSNAGLVLLQGSFIH